MKEASFIISQILSNPQFAAAHTAWQAGAFLRVALGSRYALVKFAYRRANTLFIAAAHPPHLLELRHDSNTFLIKSLLRRAEVARRFPALAGVENVVYFLSHRRVAAAGYAAIAPFASALTAGFENRATDETVRASVEKFRAVVAGILARRGGRGAGQNRL